MRWFLLLAALGCGAPPGAPPDAGADSPSEGPYPAFAPSGMPRVVNQGGATLTMPRIVTVTWTADPNAATYEALADDIGSTAFWSATTSEYGIGPATSDTSTHVRIASPPPATMADTDLDAFIADHVGGAPGSGWPVNDAQTMYVVYLPESLMLTSNGEDACNVEEGYHDETSTQSMAHIVYAVIVERCHSTLDVVPYSTETASHEMVEAATDPHVESDAAWLGFDADHWAWEIWEQRQDELADACQMFPDGYYPEPVLSNDWLSRAWSNAMASAGHDPCVPAPVAPYFNTTPLGVQPITIRSGAVTRMGTSPLMITKGYSIPVGTTGTIQLGLYSDAAMARWSVAVVEGDGLTKPPTPHVTITTAAPGGSNGDTLDVSITTIAPKPDGVLLTAISSAPDQPSHYMPMLVATQ